MKVLLVGSLCDDKWIGSLIRNLRNTSSIEIDFFHIITSDMKLSEASKLCDNIYKAQRYFPSFLYKVPKFGHILSLIDVPFSLKRFLNQLPEGKNYDVVNIHYPQNKVLRCWQFFKRVAKATIITPWGSEVLRISKLSQRIMARYITHYDYVMSSDNPRFKSQLKEILNIPEEKFLSCDFGSEMIDELCNSKLSQNEAKMHFGIDGQYTIVCGYNGGVAQNHLKIIDAIQQVRSSLPSKLMIVLPMTYNKNASYTAEVEKRLTDYNIEHIILKDYLSNSDMVCLRKCADMFIHAQETDANSVSLAEHLLCNNVVVNGSWLRYENRETFGVPYYTFDKFEDLPKVLVLACKGGSLVSEALIKSISAEGWNTVTNKWLNYFEQVSK